MTWKKLDFSGRRKDWWTHIFSGSQFTIHIFPATFFRAAFFNNADVHCCRSVFGVASFTDCQDLDEASVLQRLLFHWIEYFVEPLLCGKIQGITVYSKWTLCVKCIFLASVTKKRDSDFLFVLVIWFPTRVHLWSDRSPIRLWSYWDTFYSPECCYRIGPYRLGLFVCTHVCICVSVYLCICML